MSQPRLFLPWPSWPAPAAPAPSSPSPGLAAHEPPCSLSQLRNTSRLSARATLLLKGQVDEDTSLTVNDRQSKALDQLPMCMSAKQRWEWQTIQTACYDIVKQKSAPI